MTKSKKSKKIKREKRLKKAKRVKKTKRARRARKAKKARKVRRKRRERMVARHSKHAALKKAKALPFEAKDFLSLKELSASELDVIFKLADKMKKNPQSFYGKLKGKTLALLFQKPSIRTRVSFQGGMAQLGGGSVYMDPQELPLGERESIKDVARVLSRYCDAV